MIKDWIKLKKNQRPKTVGRLLQVKLPLLGVESLTAKVDTGAFSGSLHATAIKVIKTDNGKILQFVPHGKKEAITVDSFHKRNVTSSNGQAATRYAFETEIEILGKNYPITITLSNRSSMKYPMLVGRKFLSRHGFLVDVTINNK